MAIDSDDRGFDPGKEYLREIDFHEIFDSELQSRWVDMFGRQEANKLYNKWGSLNAGSLEFYEFKNSNPVLSKSFSETYDGDILRQACNYIYSHKEYFGTTILEVGCEAGFMTGFLAKSFPDSTIVSIDRSGSALKLAEDRMRNMNIHNVEFRNCSLSDVSEQFDTVLCMRTLQENYGRDGLPFEGEPLLYQFGLYKAATKEYTRLLVRHIKENGTLCVFERVAHDPLLCGWLLQLDNSECGALLDTYNEIECKEVEDYNTFQAFVARSGNRNSLKQILDLWYKPVSHYSSGMTSLHGWKALDYLNRNAGKLIRGVRVINKETNEQVGRFAIFSDCDGNTPIYLFIATGGTDHIHLFSYERDKLNDVQNRFQEFVDRNKAAGFFIKPITPDDEYLEGNIRLGFVKKCGR